MLDTVGNALFQSITARTAGFNTVSIGALPFASLFVLILLMFIGGSPGSCAGGVKTTTVALWGAALVSRLRGHRTVRILGRYIPADLLIRSSAVLGLAVAWNMAGVLFLSTTEAGDGVGFHDILFEQVSAFATVGLSTGLTGGLSAAGKIWIIATMFVGRLGPLTLVMGMIKQKPDHIRYPEGRVMIG